MNSEEKTSNAVSSPLENIAQEGSKQPRSRRYQFCIPVLVRVLVQEETFAPLPLEGYSRNICAGGMMVEIPNLSLNNYRRMIRSQRPVRVHAKIPDRDSEVVFYGKIVWYDFKHNNENAVCCMGISFRSLGGETQAILSNLLKQLPQDLSDNKTPFF